MLVSHRSQPIPASQSLQLIRYLYSKLSFQYRTRERLARERALIPAVRVAAEMCQRSQGATLRDERAEEGVLTPQSDAIEVADDGTVRLP